jgi:Dolichyl-phosphate-mannose-protein mannosyltransferase
MNRQTDNFTAGSTPLMGKPPAKIAAWLVLTIITLTCLCPFLGKAFHIDDPLFIWSARHIVAEPLNFYHFNVNWNGRDEAMSAVTQNPPLAAYYLALVGWLLSWSEPALHAGFLLPALAAVLGTHRLAKQFCAHPLAAALATVSAPVFLLCSTSVMCDTLMLAFWVWSLIFWMEGLAQNRAVKLCSAAFLIAACGLTKYFGFALVPLVLVYSVMQRRKFGAWLAWLAIPIVSLALYEWWTRKLYGVGALSDAFSYSQNQGGDTLVMKMRVALAFSGGCMIILLPAAPFLWGRRTLVAGIAATLVFALFLVARKKFDHFAIPTGTAGVLFVAQAALFTGAGAGVAGLAIIDLLDRTSAASALLFLWVAGTFVFVGVACWQMSGRYLLPMLPAVSILLVRRLEFRNLLPPGKPIGRLCVPLGFSLAVALMVAGADLKPANSARAAAARIRQQTAATSRTVWFEGHWGFQYYMEQQGAKPVDFWHLSLATNDAVVLPLGNSRVFEPPKPGLVSWFEYDAAPSKWLAVMNASCGAGFYSGDWGPLPFVFGPAPAERYLVFRVQ